LRDEDFRGSSGRKAAMPKAAFFLEIISAHAADFLSNGSHIFSIRSGTGRVQSPYLFTTASSLSPGRESAAATDG